MHRELCGVRKRRAYADRFDLRAIPVAGLLLASLAIAPIQAAADSGPPGPPAARRPNFLFIITDDQRWDALGVVQREQGPQARWPWFTTPHMDRIANEGLRFRNAFVVCSLCSPSRAAFLSGQYGHISGVIDNSTHFPLDCPNVAELLSQAGYKTAYIGKYHMALQQDRPGFEYVASYVSRGEYYGSTFLVNGAAASSTDWVDDAATDYALQFMRENQSHPWFIVLGFKTPHTPRQPPERARRRFVGAAVKPAVNARAAPSYGPGQRAYKGEEIGRPVETDADSSDADPYLLDYFRTISAADDNVGRLLNELDELDLADDTAVIFAGDNGYYLGEHGLGDKRSAYEESMRIPLLVRYPRLIAPGAVVDEMALNIDLAPTMLEAAGVAPPREMQGASWIPLFKGNVAGWRQAFMFEYFFDPNLPATPAMVAVRTPAAKLIHYPGHEEWTELFDLTADPYEQNNLAHDAPHKELLNKLQKELARQMVRFGDPFAESLASRRLR